MAQTIKIKRGGIASLITSTPVLAQGELILATGSLNGLNSTFFVATASNSPSLPYAKIESIANGATLASNLDNNFEGLLIHSASDNKLYRYNGTTFVELPVAAGSFDGILGVDSGGTGTASLGDGTVLIGNGTNAVETVTMTNGQFLIGNSSDNPSAVDASTIAGAGLVAATGPGTATLNVDSGSIEINDLSGTLNVDKGGTGVATLTDHGVLVGSGTDAVTALTVGTNGQLLIGQTNADPSFNAVTGVINIDNTGATTFTATANSAISGAFTSTSESIAADIATNATDIDNNFAQININTTAISTNANNIASLTAATSSYLQDADLNTIVSASTAGTDGQIAIFNGGYDIDSSVNLTYNGTTFTVNDNVSLGDGAHTITIGNDASAVVTIGHASNTVTIAGNLTVTGTTTTIDSTTVNIGDNIIVLNTDAAAQDGGIQVIDTNGNQTGSLLWDRVSNYWKAGLEGGTLYRLPEQNSTSNLTNNQVVMANSNGRLVSNGKFTTDGDYGIVADPKLSGLAGDSSATDDKVLYVTNTGEVGSVTATDTTSVTTALLAYDGTSLTFSSVIDGGTF